MRPFLLLLTALLLAGCSTTPPKPPECDGELTPINAPALGAADETRRGG